MQRIFDTARKKVMQMRDERKHKDICISVIAARYKDSRYVSVLRTATIVIIFVTKRLTRNRCISIGNAFLTTLLCKSIPLPEAFTSKAL